MGKLRKMEPGKGDVTVAEWDVEDKESVGISKAEFDKMMEDKTHLAYSADGKGNNTAIAEFDEGADTIVVVPIGHGG